MSLVGPSYTSQSVLADCQQTMNWYPEVIESQTGRAAMALYPTAGLNAIYQLGAVPTRGRCTLFGRTFFVAGTQFWELLSPNASPNTKNWSAATGQNIASDGNPVSFAIAGHQILMASGGNAYVFDISANTLVPVDPSAGAGLPVAMVAYCFGFFFALIQNNAPTPWQINASSALNATVWNGLSFAATVQVFSDNPNCIFSDSDTLLWVMSSNGIQPYSNQGSIPFPFGPVAGTLIKTGLSAPNSPAVLDNSIFWLGADQRGSGVVWRMNGFTPQRVSNHAVEFALQGYPTIADAVGVSVQDQGHSFYELHFPTANHTWRYDVATGMWHERGYWTEVTGTFSRSRACFHAFNFGMHLRGDPTTGIVYQESINFLTDNGNPIRRVRRGPHITTELEWIYFNRLLVDVETGLVTLQGTGKTTVLGMVDSGGNDWAVRVNDIGVLVSDKESLTPGTIVLTDPNSGTSWQMTISTLGVLDPVSVPFLATYPTSITMISSTGQTVWKLTVRQISAGIAQYITQPTGIYGRGPLLNLRVSKDGARTWTNFPPRDCGQAGQTTWRVYWDRLGRARDFVPELSVTDAAPWRIVEGYLEADGYTPSERLTKQIVKQT